VKYIWLASPQAATTNHSPASRPSPAVGGETHGPSPVAPLYRISSPTSDDDMEVVGEAALLGAYAGMWTEMSPCAEVLRD
jgi:hypothetical protein